MTFKPHPKPEKRIKSSIKRVNDSYSLATLRKKLWEVFSVYIRKRDSKGNIFICISCGNLQVIDNGNLQAGHYYKSEMSAALRYDEKNVNGQCRKCNIFREGNRQGYAKGLVKKYGPGILEELELRVNNKIKYGRFEYQMLIEEYKFKFKNLKI